MNYYVILNNLIYADDFNLCLYLVSILALFLEAPRLGLMLLVQVQTPYIEVRADLHYLLNYKNSRFAEDSRHL